jgi:hypothetical protein
VRSARIGVALSRDEHTELPMSGHSRSASPREKGFVASPRYRLSSSVVPCTIIGALAAAGLRSLHRPAMNRVFTELRYRPSTVAPDGIDENQVTFAGRYRLSVVENPPVTGPAAPTLLHLAMPPSAESLPWVRVRWISAGWALLRNEKLNDDTLVAMYPPPRWKNAWRRARAVPCLAAG